MGIFRRRNCPAYRRTETRLRYNTTDNVNIDEGRFSRIRLATLQAVLLIEKYRQNLILTNHILH